jgi:hypothetical protein
MGTSRPGAVRDPVIPAVACAARAVTPRAVTPRAVTPRAVTPRAVTPRAGVAGGVSTVSTAVAASTAASP